MKFKDKKFFYETLNEHVKGDWEISNIMDTDHALYIFLASTLERNDDMKEFVLVVDPDIWDSL